MCKRLGPVQVRRSKCSLSSYTDAGDPGLHSLIRKNLHYYHIQMQGTLVYIVSSERTFTVTNAVEPDTVSMNISHLKICFHFTWDSHTDKVDEAYVHTPNSQ